jgi:UDP-GlcNAc3NAcA epimerase
MKIFTVIGARPQFIKAATVSRELRRFKIPEVIVHTGQHFDANMSNVFFEEMEIPHPNYNLGISNLSHGAMTGRMIEGIEEILMKERPDWVLVYGDTNSTLAGALAASKLHIPIAHVESGLRSFEMKMPEEVNRILTDRISKKLFCPTATAVRNLEREGFDHLGTEVILSGDVMLDAVVYYRDKANEVSTVLQKEKLKDRPFALVTLHRAENTDDVLRLTSICEALREIQNEIQIVWPVHPRTRAKLTPSLLPASVKLIEPVGYFDMLTLLNQCAIVMTDSGGLQKEAYFFKKYCITLRDQTEWVELVDAKANFLVGADTTKTVTTFRSILHKPFPAHAELYGNGDAAHRIVKNILEKR